MRNLNFRKDLLIFVMCFYLAIFSSERAFAAQFSPDQSCEEIFTYIYDNHLWGTNEDGTPSSGTGSKVENVIPYMNFLINFLRDNKIRTVVDLGCGDWSFSKYINWDGIDYVGIDVVRSVISRNRKKFTKPNITFVHADALSAELPRADLLICKDVFQYLTNKDIRVLIGKLDKYTHCIITNDIVNRKRPEINMDPNQRGHSRAIDLAKPPFSLEGYKALEFPFSENVKQVFYIRNKQKTPTSSTEDKRVIK